MSLNSRIPYLLVIILWVSLLLLFLHGILPDFVFQSSNANVVRSVSRQTLTNRKALASSRFDFTPFQRRLRQRHHRHRRHHPSPSSSSSYVEVVQQPDPADSEIDPRYGVEKRLVPTGPNPLHH
uniref:CLAVATA3/ESR (CLE)-related protein 12-like n=1 Tax=Nelumbo nucifera TaxID=4432 RepID=A0A822YR48_NELNU|nr:TPA_asm: hypothetical protein HUJ06_010529 [Nelumbo nucifera]